MNKHLCIEAITYGSCLTNPDSDNDGMLDPDEVYAGTSLTNASSVLSMTNIVFDSTNLVIAWCPISGKVYAVWVNTNLMATNLTFGWHTVSGKVYSIWASTNLLSTNWYQVGGLVTATPRKQRDIFDISCFSNAVGRDASAAKM